MNETEGQVRVCVELSRAVGRTEDPIWVFFSTSDGSAAGEERGREGEREGGREGGGEGGREGRREGGRELGIGMRL